MLTKLKDQYLYPTVTTLFALALPALQGALIGVIAAAVVSGDPAEARGRRSTVGLVEGPLNVIIVQEQATCRVIAGINEELAVEIELPLFCEGESPEEFDCSSASCTCQCNGIDDCVDLAISGNCSTLGGGLACSETSETCTCFWKQGGMSCP